MISTFRLSAPCTEGGERVRRRSRRSRKVCLTVAAVDVVVVAVVAVVVDDDVAAATAAPAADAFEKAVDVFELDLIDAFELDSTVAFEEAFDAFDVVLGTVSFWAVDACCFLAADAFGDADAFGVVDACWTPPVDAFLSFTLAVLGLTLPSMLY
jgi:hypothetical protein